jgi:hypothetical protein
MPTIIELQVVISSNPMLVNQFCQTNSMGLMEILTRQQSFIVYVNSYGYLFFDGHRPSFDLE